MILLTDLRGESLNIQVKMKLPCCTADPEHPPLPLVYKHSSNMYFRSTDLEE